MSKQNSIIKHRKLDIGEAKDIENSLINQVKQDAILEYIAVCNYPEILENEQEETIDE